MADDERAVSEQVWESVRALSASDLERIQACIQRSSSGSDRPPPATRKNAVRNTIALTTADGQVQQWAPHDFIHVFLRHLHAQLQQHSERQQQQQQVASGATSSSGDAAASNMATPSTDAAPAKFELHHDDFPQLGASSTSSAGAQAPSKPIKRRITTTLLSSSQAAPVARPVPTQVAFPSLTPSIAATAAKTEGESSTWPPAWTKRNLLERRMGGGGAFSAQPFSPASPAQSLPFFHHLTVPIKKKGAPASAVWTTPAKAARPRGQLTEPHPEHSPVDKHNQVMHGFATPPSSSRRTESKSPPPLELITAKVKRSRREASLLVAEHDAAAPGDNQQEEHAQPQSEVQLQQKFPAVDTPPSSSTGKNESVGEANATSPTFTVNASAARLYGFLIANRFAGSTCAELQSLVNLLFRTDCARALNATSSQEAAEDNNAPHRHNETEDGHVSSEFCWREHCLQFAELAFNCVEPVVANVGPELSRQIEKSLSVAGICEPLREKLQQLAKQREDLRVAESARIGFSLPIQTKGTRDCRSRVTSIASIYSADTLGFVAFDLNMPSTASAARDFALPFCEETDSRLHYRSPADAQLYSNREKVRDSFLNLLRQFQRQQHSLLGIENASVAAGAIEAARSLLAEAAPENRWWFAKFFVMELIQVGANPLGESDKDLVLKIMEDKLVGKNPDRLRKLHRRFTSQKPSSPAAAATPTTKSSGGSSSTAKTGGGPSRSSKGNTNNNTNNRQHHQASGKASAQTNRNDRSAEANQATTSAVDGVMAALARVRPFLADSQVFFFHFLHSCDSYEFSRLVTHHLEWQFTCMWGAKGRQSDPRKTFTEDVLKLKVVAKFLGYLRFSPLWHVSSSVAQRAEHNSAFTAAKREGISTLEMSTPAGKGGNGVDVKKLVEDSILTRSVAKCVPWLCDYLCMLSLDKLSAGTRYFRQLFVLLAQLYHSPRLAALGEAGLHVAFQIERVFQTLDLDLIELTHSGDFHDPTLLPPAPVRLALEAVDDAMPEEDTDEGEDALPFLYNQVFIQTCISELDDLRGYIQARSAPSLRVAGSRRVGSGSAGDTPQGGSAGGAPTHRAHPIRKLRPLQVIIDKPGTTRKLSFFDNDSDSQLDSGKREASPVKRQDKEVVDTEDGDGSEVEQHHLGQEEHQQHDDALTNAIFKSSPNLKSVVEFVVDAVATNVCNHAMQHVVCARADVLVNRSVESSGLAAMDKAQAASEEASSARRTYRELMEKQLPRELAATVAAVVDEALRLGESRVRAAVPALVPPSTHPTMAHSAVAVAVSRVHLALRTLIPKTSRTEFVKRVSIRNKSILREASPSASSASSSIGQSSSVSVAATGDKDNGNVARVLSSAFDDHAGDEDEAMLIELLLSLKQNSAEIARLVRGSTRRRLTDGHTGDWDGDTASKVSRRVSAVTRALCEYAEIAHDAPASSPTRQQVSEDSTLLWDALYRATSWCLQFLAIEQPLTEDSRAKAESLVGRTASLLDATVELFAPMEPRRLSAFADLVVDWALNVVPLPAASEEDERWKVQMHAQLVSALQASLRAHSIDVELAWQRHRISLLAVEGDDKDAPTSSSSSDSRHRRFQQAVWRAVDARK